MSEYDCDICVHYYYKSCVLDWKKKVPIKNCESCCPIG